MLKTRVEIFGDQEQAATRIEHLKNNGFQDADMFLIAKGEERIDNIRGTLETLSDDQSAIQSSLWDRFRRLIGAREEFQAVFERMGMEETMTEEYTEAVENGKVILIIASEKIE